MENNTQVFVARQPILNRRGALVAHEMLFRDRVSNGVRVTDHFGCTAAVVEHAMGAFGLDALLGHGDGYLNCSDEFLYSDLVNMLPPDRIVLEILETTPLTTELGKRCDELRSAGFRIALDDVRTLTPEIEAFLPHVNLLKLDWPYIGAGKVASVVTTLKRAGKMVVAEKVETREDRDVALLAGCDLLQGFYFTKPQTLSAKKLPVSSASLLRILQLLMQDIGSTDIERALRDAPTLTIQLIRLANSSDRLRSRRDPITSVKQAFAVVGSRNLARWCCLLLYGDGSGLTAGEDPLVRLVERRAVFMEKVCQDLVPENTTLHDKAYLVGLLSLAHVVYGIDAETFVGELALEPAMRAALVGRQGLLGTLLAVAQDLEEGRYERMLARSEAMNLPSLKNVPILML